MKNSDKITEALRCDVVPWAYTDHFPFYNATGGIYRGMNSLLLNLSTSIHHFKNNEWATYKQWNSLGYKVKSKPEDSETDWGTKIFADNGISVVFNKDQVFPKNDFNKYQDVILCPNVLPQKKTYTVDLVVPDNSDYELGNKWYSGMLPSCSFESCEAQDQLNLVRDLTQAMLGAVLKIPYDKSLFEKYKLIWIDKIDRNYKYITDSVKQAESIAYSILK